MRTLALTGLLFASACSTDGGSGCALALPGWLTAESDPPHYVVKNTVRLSGGDIFWNGVTVDEETLAMYLRKTAAEFPLPFVVFEEGPNDCAFAGRVGHLIDQNYPCREGACGQGPAGAFNKS